MSFESFNEPDIQKDSPKLEVETPAVEKHTLHKPSTVERFKKQFMPVALASFVTFSNLSQAVAEGAEKITDSENGQITKVE